MFTPQEIIVGFYLVTKAEHKFVLASFPGSTPQLFSHRAFLHGARKAGEWSLGTRLVCTIIAVYDSTPQEFIFGLYETAHI